MLRIESDLTNVLFTATDKNNRYITTLRETDIRVLEDGVPQKLFTFQRETDRPLSIAFLIDVSISEERTLRMKKRPRGFLSKTLFARAKTRQQLFLSKATHISNSH